MNRFKRLLAILLGSLVLVWGFLFALSNDTPLPLDLVLVKLPPQRASWWLLASFVAGMLAAWLLGLLARFFGWVRRRRAPRPASPPV